MAAIPRRQRIPRADLVLYGMLSLPLLYYLLFHYAPMYGTLIAFKSYNIFKGFWGSPWAGFDNFRALFDLRDFWRVVENTLLLNGLSLLFGFPVPIALALLLNEIHSRRYRSITQSLMYLPHFFSWVIIGGILIQILSPRTGFVNHALRGLGVEPIYFLGNENWWVVVFVLGGIWKEAGWSAIIYVAALTGVDPQLYEAARIDGANRWVELGAITLPGILPTISAMLILAVSRILLIGFEQPYILQNALVLERADVISTFIYTQGIQQSQFSLTTAMGLFQSLIGLGMVLGANWAIRRMGQEGIL